MGVQEYTLNEIWDGLLDATRLTRVYDRLAKFYGIMRWLIRWLLALSAVGCLGVIADWSPFAGFGVIISIILLTVTALDMVTDYSAKRVVLGAIAREYSHLETKWRRLNGMAENLTDKQARVRIDELLTDHRKLDEKADGIGVVTFEWLNKRCEKVACRIHAPNWQAPKKRLFHAR